MTKQELRSLIQSVMMEIQEEMDEVTTTASIDGYKTPHAFKKTTGKDVDDEPDKDYVKRLNTSTGYTLVNEGNRWQDLRADDSRTPNQKIGYGIREIRKQLSEIELFLKWYSKIKEESGLDRDKFWRRTNRHLEVIGNRIDKISERIKNL